MNPAIRNALRTGAVLFVFALLGTALLSYTHEKTAPAIARSQEAEKRALIQQVMPASLHDNDLLASAYRLAPDPLLGTRSPSTAWVARKDGRYVGLVLEAIAPDGYSGDIALLVGIDAEGRILGVRVTRHRETPGLGDYIDRAKSTWIDQFGGRSLGNSPPRGWAVTRDGGDFDARTGATITARAVVKALQRALTYHARHRDRLAASADDAS